MKHSAGILCYRILPSTGVEILLIHPGGPFWAKNQHCWGIPKGEFNPEDEPPRVAAIREFQEETGVYPGTIDSPTGLPEMAELPSVQGTKKVVTPYAFNYVECWHEAFKRLHQLDLTSNTCEVRWRGATLEVPEVDQYQWVPIQEASVCMIEYQRPLVESLLAHLRGNH